MTGLGGFDMVDQRRQGGRLAAAGGAGHQHQPVVRGGDGFQHLGQLQLFDRGDLGADRAQDHPGTITLIKQADPEPAQFRNRHRRIAIFRGLECLQFLLASQDFAG